jgi:predicted O-methyltransferase YrrM
VEELGVGRLTSVDRETARGRVPSATEMMEKSGLRPYVDLIFHPISYNWFLMDCIREGRKFDFCFLDGAHTWEVDGLAFYLVNECLVPGGMIIFDDLDWSFANSPSLHDKPYILGKPEFERNMCQIRQVFELLVKRHASFTDAYEVDGLGFAKKVSR